MPTLKWETALHRGLKQDSLFPSTETCLTTLMTNDDKQDNMFSTETVILTISQHQSVPSLLFGLDGPGSKADRRERFFSPPKRPECLGPTHIFTKGVPGFFRGVKRPGRKADYSHPALRLRIIGDTPPFSIHTFMARAGTTYVYQDRVTTNLDNIQIQNSRS